jgi:hypothetical protein
MLVICLLATITAIAQPETSLKKKITKFELIAGAGVLSNSGKYEDYILPKYGYSIGTGVLHSFNESVEFRLRALWELKGSK